MRLCLIAWLVFAVAACAPVTKKPQKMRDPSAFEVQAAHQFEQHEFQSNQAFYEALENAYAHLVASELNDGQAHLNNKRLSGLFQDAYVAFFYSNDARYAKDMRAIHDTLETRGVATEKQTKKLFDAYLVLRDFVQAVGLQKQHEHLAKHAVPKIQGAVVSGLSVFGVSSASGWRKQPVDLNQVRLIVVTNPLCHFSNEALQAINNDAQVRAWFAKHALLLMDQKAVTYAHAAAPDWNQTHPDLVMHHVVSESDWPMIDSWATPTFYFIHDGKEVEHMTGWRKDQEPMSVLKAAIERANQW